MRIDTAMRTVSRCCCVCSGALLLALAAGGGCAKSWKVYKNPAFVTEADTNKYLKQALEAEAPDDRRAAIVQIAQTRFVRRDTVISAMSTIARTDDSSSVRCAAVRALGVAGTAAVAEPLCALCCEHPEQRECLPPDDAIRWDALDALLSLARTATLDEAQQGELTDSAKRLLGSNPSRDVRMSAARVLGHLPREDVLPALIDALRQRDFGVVYEADLSLMALTGQNFNHDPVAWNDWLQQTREPFAQRGRLDAQLRPPPQDWWSQTTGSMKRTLSRFGPKENL